MRYGRTNRSTFPPNASTVHSDRTTDHTHKLFSCCSESKRRAGVLKLRTSSTDSTVVVQLSAEERCTLLLLISRVPIDTKQQPFRTQYKIFFAISRIRKAALLTVSTPMIRKILLNVTAEASSNALVEITITITYDWTVLVAVAGIWFCSEWRPVVAAEQLSSRTQSCLTKFHC